MEGEIGHTLLTPLGTHLFWLLWGRSRSASFVRGHQTIGRRAARRADTPSKGQSGGQKSGRGVRALSLTLGQSPSHMPVFRFAVGNGLPSTVQAAPTLPATTPSTLWSTPTTLWSTPTTLARPPSARECKQWCARQKDPTGCEHDPAGKCTLHTGPVKAGGGQPETTKCWTRGAYSTG